MIDLLAIIPFNIFLKEPRSPSSSSNDDGQSTEQDQDARNANELARILRLYRISKLIKLTKLFRVAKIGKNKNMISSYANSLMRLSKSAEKMMLFFIISILAYHIVSCMWILTAQMSKNSYEANWIDSNGFD